MVNDGKCMKSHIFHNRDQAQEFFKSILKECKVKNPENLEKALEISRIEVALNEVIVICMNCNTDKEKEFVYEVEEVNHRLVCVIM